MIWTLIISILTCILLILSVLFKPNIIIKGIKIQTFWIVTLIGAILIVSFGFVPLKLISDKLLANSSINPIKILVLFISISFLSITLDELGFFSYIAVKAIKKVNNNQYKLFFILYFLVAILTIFTSNDIVILTFTPFICYFSKKAKINPLPYLIMEFINANTFSMLFTIGNPTNIYLSQSFNISFLEYLKIMALPTFLCGMISCAILLILFKKDLTKKISEIKIEHYPLNNKKLIIVNLVHLGLTTVLLAICSYINIEMWLISLIFAISLAIFVTIHTIKKEDRLIFHSLKRLPINLIPFLLSMFIIITTLEHQEIILRFAKILNSLANNKNGTIISHLLSSTIFSNLINNIPMTVFFSSVISNGNPVYLNASIYASVIGSNVGAYLTPIGALAGIMWMSILKTQDVKFSFIKFIKYGLILVPLVLLGGYLGLIIAI